MVLGNKFKSILEEVLSKRELYTIQSKKDYIGTNYNLSESERKEIEDLLENSFIKAEEICIELRNSNKASYYEFESKMNELFNDYLTRKSMSILYNWGMIASK